MTDKQTADKRAGNLSLWNEVDTVPTAYTKPASVGSYKFTSINGHWHVMKATELWGPVGVGWGFEIVAEEIIEGGPITDYDKKVVYLNDRPFLTKTHVVHMKVWYTHDNMRVETPVGVGITDFVNKNGATDHEAPKKSRTDALKNCLKYVGFAADIFLGEWEDEEYRALAAQAGTIESDEKKERIHSDINAERKAFLEKNLGLIEEAVNLSMLSGVYNVAHRTLQRQLAQPGLAKEDSEKLQAAMNLLTKRYTQKKTQLEESKNGNKTGTDRPANGSGKPASGGEGKKGKPAGSDQEPA